MNFARVEMYRQMRGKLHTAIKRGRLAVLDIGSSKITGTLRGTLTTGLRMIWLILRYRFKR